MSVVLRLPLPPAGLRRNHAAAWQAQKRLKDAYSLIVWQSTLEQQYVPPARLQGPLRASLLWLQTGRGDVDNCLSGAKVIFDCLGMAPVTNAGADRTYCGLYESDGQIEEIVIRRRQVKTKSEEHVQVELTEVS